MKNIYKVNEDAVKKIAERVYDNGSTVINRNDLEEMFPELKKESEDEKVREALIYHYQGDGCLCNNKYRIDYKDIRDWLEKQGKKESVDKIEPKFKVKYAGSKYNVLEIKDIAGITYYGIEDEPNHIDYVLPENCERVDDYNIKESGSPFPTKPAKFSKQDFVWSEEDEEMYKKIETAIDSYYAPFSRDTEEMSEWLKSLKERVQPQPKQGWSEEDEQYLEDTLNLLEGHRSKNTYGDVVEWLKSLKDRYAWKPSDEQMKVLKLSTYCPSEQMSKVLFELYQDLMKLREEFTSC